MGEFTDELADFGAGAVGKGFFSCGPKNYGIQVRFPNGEVKSKVKVKGITFNSEVQDILTYETMKDFAIKYIVDQAESVDVPQKLFKCNKHHDVFTKDIYKSYQVVFEKRANYVNYTYPFGTVF